MGCAFQHAHTVAVLSSHLETPILGLVQYSGNMPAQQVMGPASVLNALYVTSACCCPDPADATAVTVAEQTAMDNWDEVDLQVKSFIALRFVTQPLHPPQHYCQGYMEQPGDHLWGLPLYLGLLPPSRGDKGQAASGSEPAGRDPAYLDIVGQDPYLWYDPGQLSPGYAVAVCHSL